MLRFFLLFVVLLAVLFGLELTPWAQAWFVKPWTGALASLSTWLVTLFDGNVVASGKVMRSTTNGFAVSIEAGCNGVEATLVLLAAMLAFPAPWKHKVRRAGHRHTGRAAAQHPARDQPVLPRAMELRRVRVGAPVRVAGADHARRARRLADLGPARAALRRRGHAAVCRHLRSRPDERRGNATGGGQRACAVAALPEKPADAVRGRRAGVAARDLRRVVSAGAGPAVARAPRGSAHRANSASPTSSARSNPAARC